MNVTVCRPALPPDRNYPHMTHCGCYRTIRSCSIVRTQSTSSTTSPAVAPLRTEFRYNNLAYEALGQVIEKVSGTDYASFLRHRVLEPLGMSQTFYTDFPADDANVALPYIALRNATPFQIPQPIHGNNVMIGAGGGIRSSVRDMLRFYNALIDAAHAEIGGFADTVPQNPLKGLKHIWRGMVSLPAPTLREYSYAFGWFRVQLPALPPFADDHGPGINPPLGQGLPSRLGLIHGGEHTRIHVLRCHLPRNLECCGCPLQFASPRRQCEARRPAPYRGAFR